MCWLTVKAACTDAIVDAERRQVLLMGQMQRRTCRVCQPDEP